MAINRMQGYGTNMYMGEVMELIRSARPQDIVSFDMVTNPEHFDREIRLVIRVPWERDSVAEVQRRDFERMRFQASTTVPLERLTGLRFDDEVTGPPSATPPVTEEDEDDERLKRLGIR